ncbi:MAG: nickel pincer cofactor biosynthesis protein LarC [Planctomycetota bacterium]
MRCGYFDCFSGASGDMILAALVSAGVRIETLREVIQRLHLTGVEVEASHVRRSGLAGTHVHILVPPEAQRQHRHLPQIMEIIAGAGLPPVVADNARRIFHRLAAAEAAVHGIPPEQVHFHEVGAADAIVDVVGACVGLHELKIERVVCAPLPAGSGTVTCAHGVLPVPAPATAELLKGVPLAACDEPGELTTPTGAAILTTLAESFGPLPPMRIATIGYGAGTRENQSRPNILRLLVGEVEGPASVEGQDRVTVLETQVDDATGQMVAHAAARLLEAGALDVYAAPIVMKKGRPGQLLTVICGDADAAGLQDLLFAETTTFGIRRHECARRTLAREHMRVTTAFGPIRVKVGRSGGRVVQAWPEYEDCAAAAREHGVALREVQAAALRAWAEAGAPPTGGSAPAE